MPGREVRPPGTSDRQAPQAKQINFAEDTTGPQAKLIFLPRTAGQGGCPDGGGRTTEAMLARTDNH